MRSQSLKKYFQKNRGRSDRKGNGVEKGELEWFRRYGPDLVMGIVFAFILSLMFPTGKSFQFADLKEGRVYVGSEIIAPFTFAVNKSDDEYQADIEEARASVAPVFEREKSITDSQLEKLTFFLDQLLLLLKEGTSQREDLEALFRDFGIVMSEEDLINILTGFDPEDTENSLVQKRHDAFVALNEIIITQVRELFASGILDVEKSGFLKTTQKISLRQDGEEVLEDLDFYQDMGEVYNSVLEKLRDIEELNEKRIKIAYQIVTHFIVPNVLYDGKETESRVENAIANVPLAKDQVLAGERIIDSHQRVTKQHIDKLNSLAAEKAERGEVSGFWARLAPNLGKYLLCLALLSFLVIFLWQDRREVVEDRKQLLMIALTILVIALLTFACNRTGLSSYLIPVSMAAIIITIFFDTYVGFLTSLVLSFLIGAMRGDEYGIVFVSLLVCSAAVLSVSLVRTRNWVLRSMAAVTAAYLFSITVHNFLSYASLRDIMIDWGFGMANGFLAPMFAYGLVIVLEYAFDMTTDMTLLELSDLNQPLLRQLAMQAPGTYHHSIMVGNLAEAAAEAIGANALLARVGAYYHDIGKLEKPEYFVENQAKGRNPQEKLSPAMSSLILLNHVRKGAEMAHLHGLPKEIEAFIYQHHGTALMSYFYQKAVQQSAEEKVVEDKYRYPGPRPKSRETAIVMLADAVEAASRTLKDPSPSRLRNLVEGIIDERFKNGELDDSPLTLQDLSKIAEAFQKILNGVFHGRVEYPAREASN